MRSSKLFVSFLLAAMLVIVAAGAAFAQRQSTPRTATGKALTDEEVKQLLLLMDTDKNGKISRQEYLQFMQAEFSRLDVDKSGELDPKELTKSNLRPSAFSGEDDVKRLLLMMDTDKNGKISRTEYMQFVQAEFDRLDKDKNGELDPKELTESRLRPSTFSTVGK
jgi:Ca2+-binding EF-hand superfamily protein